MADHLEIIDALVMYGQESADNLSKLIAARDAAFDSIMAGNGAQLASGSGNGLSFQVSMAGLTNSAWFATLQRAIRQISSGLGSGGRTYVTF